MRTKTRLTLWLGLVTLLVLTLAAVSLGTIWKLRSEGQDVLKANYSSIEYAQRMLTAVDLENDTTSDLHVLAEQLANQRANVTEKGEAEMTDLLARHIDALRLSPGDPVITRALHKDLNSIIDVNRSAIVRKAALAGDRAERAVMWISIVGTICFLIAFTLFLSLPERIAEPIRKLTEGIDRIAKGQYRERVELGGSDEFAHMAVRFNAMAEELEKWENSNVARIMDEKARAEAVINSLQDASIGLDEHGHLLFMNRMAIDLLGTGEEGSVGRPVAEVAQHNDLLRHVLSEKAMAPFKVVIGGKENYFVATSTSIRGASGPLGTVCTVRNITPFQERDQAKTHFLATITHELKTPLASTDIGLTLLERNGPTSMTADQQAIVNDLRKDHQRLVRIVSELLDLAQAETGNIRLKLDSVDIHGVINASLDAVKANAQQKNIRFALLIEDELPYVQADSERSVWVLVNLLSNAVRHSPENGVITLSSARRGQQLDIIIADEGPGIPLAEQERVFMRFAHPEASAHRGTGLGLSIAKEFMEAMGGDVLFDKERTQGASFSARFRVV